MIDPRLKRMVDNVINRSLEIKPNQVVLIESSKNCSAAIKYMVELIAKKGAIPLIYFTESEIKRAIVENGTQEQFELMAKHDIARLKDVDVYINMVDSENSYDMSDVSQEKRNIYQQYYFKPINFGVIVPEKRWITVDYPSISAAQRAAMSTEEYEKYFFSAVNIDYDKLSRAMAPLKELLDKANKVKIESPTTNLIFELGKYQAEICDGKINIPDGEVFIAPLKESVNGHIKFNVPSRYQGTVFNNIELLFKDGQVIKAKADNNNEKLNQILDTDAGSRYVGEFAIGTNPNIKKPITNILFDEKILGSIHFALGHSHKLSDNGNESAIHWDIVKLLTKEHGGGKIYLDDTLLQENGVFIPEELQQLNHKRLIKKPR